MMGVTTRTKAALRASMRDRLQIEPSRTENCLNRTIEEVSVRIGRPNGDLCFCVCTAVPTFTPAHQP